MLKFWNLLITTQISCIMYAQGLDSTDYHISSCVIHKYRVLCMLKSGGSLGEGGQLTPLLFLKKNCFVLF